MSAAECGRIGVKMHPDRLLNRFAWNKTIHEARIFKTLYKTASGWREDMEQVLFYPYYPHDDLEAQPWNAKFKSNIPEVDRLSFYLACDVRHDSYFMIGGKRYDDIHEAEDAMYDELFIKPAVIPIFNIIMRELKAKEHREGRTKA